MRGEQHCYTMIDNNCNNNHEEPCLITQINRSSTLFDSSTCTYILIQSYVLF